MSTFCPLTPPLTEAVAKWITLNDDLTKPNAGDDTDEG